MFFISKHPIFKYVRNFDITDYKIPLHKGVRSS